MLVSVILTLSLSCSGDDGSGKTTLMTKLQGVEHNKKGRGLEYLYLNVHDEDRDGKAATLQLLCSGIGIDQVDLCGVGDGVKMMC